MRRAFSLRAPLNSEAATALPESLRTTITPLLSGCMERCLTSSAARAAADDKATTSGAGGAEPKKGLDAESLRNFLRSTREYKLKLELYRTQYDTYDKERRSRVLSWRVEFRQRQEEEAAARRAREEARLRDKEAAKEAKKAARSSPEALSLRRAREEVERRDAQRRTAMKEIRYYMARTVRERFDEAFLAHLRAESAGWVTEADLEARVQQALESPVPLWSNADGALKRSWARSQWEIKREEVEAAAGEEEGK